MDIYIGAPDRYKFEMTFINDEWLDGMYVSEAVKQILLLANSPVKRVYEFRVRDIRNPLNSPEIANRVTEHLKNFLTLNPPKSPLEFQVSRELDTNAFRYRISVDADWPHDLYEELIRITQSHSQDSYP